MKKFILIILFTFTSFTALAQSYYCPSTSRYIGGGNTMDQVTLNCGSPTTMRTEIVPKIESVKVVQWIYDLGPVSGQPTAARSTVFTQGGSVLMFSIRDGKVVDIRVAGASVPSTTACASQLIKLEDLSTTVNSLCGDNRIENEGVIDVKTGTKQVSTWIYDRGPYQSQMKITFEDGKLMTIEFGQFQ